MLLRHPVLLLVSLLGAVSYCVLLKGGRAAAYCLKTALPVLLLTFLLNPVFSHEGVTILLYLPWGNPLTLESVAFGASSAVMLSAEICWFGCLSEVMTSDKYICLFGKVSPSLSLAVSMILRFVPRLTEKGREILAYQRCNYGKSSFTKKIRAAAATLSALLTWSLENSVDTADSMKSRGWGVQKRSSYSPFVFEPRDTAAVVFLLSCAAYIAVTAALGAARWQYYPSISGQLLSPDAVLCGLVFAGLCFLPAEVNLYYLLAQKGRRLNS